MSDTDQLAATLAKSADLFALARQAHLEGKTESAFHIVMKAFDELDGVKEAEAATEEDRVTLAAALTKAVDLAGENYRRSRDEEETAGDEAPLETVTTLTEEEKAEAAAAAEDLANRLDGLDGEDGDGNEKKPDSEKADVEEQKPVDLAANLAALGGAE